MIYGCVASDLAVAVYEWNVQESSSWLSQLVLSMLQNPEEEGSNASEGMNFLVRERANWKKEWEQVRYRKRKKKHRERDPDWKWVSAL